MTNGTLALNFESEELSPVGSIVIVINKLSVLVVETPYTPTPARSLGIAKALTNRRPGHSWNEDCIGNSHNV
jgi:hypothetical protein